MLLKKTIAIAALAISMLCMPGKAEARWRVAESEHFVVYADDSERDLQRFGEMLERYHAGLELATGRQMATPSPSNRLTVFVVGGQRDIAELSGRDSRSLAGFYIPRASGSIAFVQDIRPSSRITDFSMIILLHEYAHHFFSITSPFALPEWMSEGAAEFFASARFPANGNLEIGRPADHRMTELIYADDVPIRRLLDYNNLAVRDSNDAFYGRSWLLYHYLMMTPERTGQLTAYLQALNADTSPLQAGEQVFGDLDRLENELNIYMRRRSYDGLVVDADYLITSPVTVRALSDGMNENLPLLIRSKRGVNREQALELVEEIRTVAQRYPGDADVLAALAEAEYDSGNDTAAIAAADRAIAIDPSVTNAYVQKGYALFRLAGEAGDDADYRAAMAPFQALNRIENDHPLPLIYFYRRFKQSGEAPSELAQAALQRASQLAPFDIGLRLELVQMLAQNGEIRLSGVMLDPLLANPHDANLRQLAQSMERRLETAVEGEPISLAPSPVMTTRVPPPSTGEDNSTSPEK